MGVSIVTALLWCSQLRFIELLYRALIGSVIRTELLASRKVGQPTARMTGGNNGKKAPQADQPS
jgi:hypothetical protein